MKLRWGGDLLCHFRWLWQWTLFVLRHKIEQSLIQTKEEAIEQVIWVALVEETGIGKVGGDPLVGY